MLNLTVRKKLFLTCLIAAVCGCLILVGCSGGKNAGGPNIRPAANSEDDGEGGGSGAPGAKAAGGMPGMGGGMPGMGGGMPGMGGGMPGMGGGMPGMGGGMPGMGGGMGAAASAAPVAVAELPEKPTFSFSQMVAGKSVKTATINGQTIYKFVFKDFYNQPWKCELPSYATKDKQTKEVWINTFIAYKRSIVDTDKKKSVVVDRRVNGFPFISPPPERTASTAGSGMGAGMGMGMMGAGMAGRMPGMPGMPGMGAGGAGRPAGMPGMPGMGAGGAGMPGMPGMGAGGAGRPAGMPGMPGAGGGLPGMPGMQPPR